MEETLQETRYLDWQGNIIQPGDKIKLICVELPKSDILVPVENSEDKTYVLPEHYNLKKPLSHYCLKPIEPEFTNVWKVIETKEIETFQMMDVILPVIRMDNVTIMFLENYLELVEKYMHNLIIAIEGKSDDEGMFYEKYFEA